MFFAAFLSVTLVPVLMLLFIPAFTTIGLQ
jgi:hypothetical protein